MSVRSFLCLPCDDNGLGGLNRSSFLTGTQWLCQSHFNRAFTHFNTEVLEEYVRSQGGSIDLQLGTISIGLSSPLKVDMFATTLVQGDRFFDLSLSSHGAHRIGTANPLQHLSRSHNSVLQINGVTLNVQQCPQEYGRDIFAVQMGFRSQLSGKLIILLRYPQPSQSYIYFSKQWVVVGVLFDGMVNRLNADWMGLASALYPFYRRLRVAMVSGDQALDVM